MQVHDVKMQNEYNLRLKDAAMHDKVRELTERHAADMGQAEAKSAALQQDMEQQRLLFEEKLQEAAEHQQVLHNTLWCYYLCAGALAMCLSDPQCHQCACAPAHLLHCTHLFSLFFVRRDNYGAEAQQLLADAHLQSTRHQAEEDSLPLVHGAAHLP